jgi:hypothetical protein
MFNLFRSYLIRKRKASYALYAEALRDENCGEFAKAIVNYEAALELAKKARFPNSSLVNKIIEKLKILRRVIDYNNNSEVKQAVTNGTR